MHVGQHWKRVWGSLVVGAGLIATACSGGTNNGDGGADGGGNLSCELNAGEFDGGVEMTGSLQPASAFDAGFTSTAPNTPDSIEVTISGETLGENGLPFVPVNPGDPQFVDGWNVKFDKYIVVVGHVRLSPQALLCSPTALSPLLTPPVATKDGPFAVDVHQLDVNAPGDFVGADGMEPAGALFTFPAQDNGQPFDTGTLYAFTYDTVPATYAATNVNLPQADMAAYAEMVAHGWDKYIEAEAEYVGYGADTSLNGGATPQSGTTPYQDPDGGDYTQTHEFAKLPQHIHFAMGWHDATTSVNCINTANGNFDGDNEANRGVQPNSAEATRAQITIHTDHFFWDKLKQEGTPLRMDPIAAWMPEWDGGTNAPFDLSLLSHLPLATTFPDCTPLPDRAIDQNVPITPGESAFMSDQANPEQVVLNLNGVPATNVAGISNFMAFSVQSQTHLNANGLCYIIGQNSADPFFEPDVVPLDSATPYACDAGTAN